MKHTATDRHYPVRAYQPAYPNAADPSYFANKAANALTILVSSLGFVSVMLFLITLS